MNIDNLVSYLQKRFTGQTVKSYLWAIEKFIEVVGADNCALTRYKDIMDYIGHLREQGQNANYIANQLAAVKVLFAWMVKTGQRMDNPAYGLILNDSFHKPVQFQDLFSAEELKMLLLHKERFATTKYRNQVFIGLLIYQALSSEEIEKLRVQDIDLENKRVFIAATRKLNSRVLPLEPSQCIVMEYYIRYERPQLLRGSLAMDHLLISSRGLAETVDSLLYLVSRCRQILPGRKLTTVTIRQSVIINKFKEGWDIRKVQLFAGHKYASTTERYRPVNMEALKAEILKFHPLG